MVSSKNFPKWIYTEIYITLEYLEDKPVFQGINMRDMRRSDRKINKKEALRILSSGGYGVLSTVCPDNQPSKKLHLK